MIELMITFAGDHCAQNVCRVIFATFFILLELSPRFWIYVLNIAVTNTSVQRQNLLYFNLPIDYFGGEKDLKRGSSKIFLHVYFIKVYKSCIFTVTTPIWPLTGSCANVLFLDLIWFTWGRHGTVVMAGNHRVHLQIRLGLRTGVIGRDLKLWTAIIAKLSPSATISWWTVLFSLVSAFFITFIGCQGKFPSFSLLFRSLPAIVSFISNRLIANVPWHSKIWIGTLFKHELDGLQTWAQDWEYS